MIKKNETRKKNRPFNNIFRNILRAFSFSKTPKILEGVVRGDANFERVTDEDVMTCFVKKTNIMSRNIPRVYDLNKDQLPEGVKLDDDFQPLGSFSYILEGEYYLICFCDM